MGYSVCEKLCKVLELCLHGDPKAQVAILQSIYHAQLDCRQPHAPKRPESSTGWNMLKPVEKSLKAGTSGQLCSTCRILKMMHPGLLGTKSCYRCRCDYCWRVKATVPRKCHLQTLGSLGHGLTVFDHVWSSHQPSSTPSSKKSMPKVSQTLQNVRLWDIFGHRPRRRKVNTSAASAHFSTAGSIDSSMQNRFDVSATAELCVPGKGEGLDAFEHDI